MGFTYQYGIQRSSTQQLVPTNKEVKAVLPKHQGLPYAPHLHVIFGRSIQRHRVSILLGLVHHHHARSTPQQHPGFLWVDGEAGFDGDGLRMRTQRWDPHRRTTAFDTGVPKNLLGFPGHLHFFLRVPVGLELVNVRNHVERQLVGKHFVFNLFSLCPTSQPIFQLIHALCSGSGRGLVGGHDHFLQPLGLVERPERHRGNRRRAVGVGDQRLPGHRVGVDLGNNKRNFRFVSES
mmetsp:Transcript_4752/g.6519  ORF Transcript_4752/g.6519 Transcript_4752/m.6519 type:complete len:235 (-) Transcript_4752:408-1112(-)